MFIHKNKKNNDKETTTRNSSKTVAKDNQIITLKVLESSETQENNEILGHKNKIREIIESRDDNLGIPIDFGSPKNKKK